MIYEKMTKKRLIKILRERDKMIKKLKYYADIDGMTKVLNKRAGLELLNKKLEVVKTNGENLFVCYIDVDRFKFINDKFGHKEGDKVLIGLSKILKSNIRSTDRVIRMGGDEFLVVFPQTTMDNVEKVWTRIYRSIEEANKKTFNCKLSLSYGIYQYKQGVQDEICADDLIDKADAAMYKEKRKKKEEL